MKKKIESLEFMLIVGDAEAPIKETEIAVSYPDEVENFGVSTLKKIMDNVLTTYSGDASSLKKLAREFEEYARTLRKTARD